VRRSMSTQRGVAAIYLMFVIIPLFGMVFLALEGTRFIQEKSRLGDATEAAALAVAMANRDNVSTGYEKTLATGYILSYMGNLTKINLLTVDRDKTESTQFEVIVNIERTSWFYSEIIPGFNKTEPLANRALVRTNSTADKPKLIIIDI